MIQCHSVYLDPVFASLLNHLQYQFIIGGFFIENSYFVPIEFMVTIR